MGELVDVDDVVRAGVSSRFDRLVALYSFAVVDISEGATLHVPDGSGRHQTVMVINEDGYVDRVVTGGVGTRRRAL